jgi:hypothetical protein
MVATMHINETSSSEEQIKLWKLISDSVWHSKRRSIASLLVGNSSRSEVHHFQSQSSLG